MTTTATDIALSPASELAGLVARRQISSRELLDCYLARIERVNPAINAVVTIDAERARHEAAAADGDAAKGRLWGPLHGLPMTVKDSFETSGMHTTAGTPELAQHTPARDAEAVARLRAAGAVIIGKTNLPPYTLDVQSANALFGATGNPWDLTCSAGGSSGGAAAAVATGLTTLELGSDIAGSIRIPAHCCGVYGLKPTYGIVPTRGHIPPAPGSLAELDLLAVGPLARCAEDLGLALRVLAGPGPDAAVAWRLDLPAARHHALREYRIAAWLDDPACSIDHEVSHVFGTLVKSLREAGVEIDERARPVELAESDRLAQQLLQAAISHLGSQETFDELCNLAATPIGDDNSPRTRWTRDVTQRARDHNLAHERRLKLAARWKEFFRRYDVLLCPVTPTTAIPHDHSEDNDARTISINGEPRPYWDQVTWPLLPGVVHLPVVVAPVGRTPTGMPVGIQIIGRHLEDRTPIDVARQMTQLVGGFDAPPQSPPHAASRSAALAPDHSTPNG